ncbi:hypothetical protein PYW07_013260 [Mythimna separata]|uniref:V-type proton ATPase subunit S1/VOA1 transmembrane domain-containing protein n=1 Tax=Mythimna separata TaxID=271217 RepID=A0AAD7Y5Y1_MYTSE|nr:hypothetical protein PYW07_013260 [Mythimna separata]
MSTSKFSEIIHDSARRSTGIIIFVENKFSVEDISTKDVATGTPYKNLHAALLANRATLKYFPNVIEPFNALVKLFPKTQSNVHYLAQNSKLRLKDNFKHLYILFRDDASESKFDILRRHDTVIKEVMSAARRLKAGPVIAYYTGRHNPVYVPKVEFVKNLPNVMSRSSGVFLSSPWALLRVFGIFTGGTQTRRAVHSEAPTVSAEVRSQTKQRTKWRFTEFELEWIFKFDTDYWRILDVVMYEGQEEVGRAILDIQCPYNRSYYCPEPIMIVNTRDGSIVTFEKILVEPKNDLETTWFNPSIHCTPFFNGVVLAGLFVTYIFLGITLFGLAMIFDCQANGRFEDADGKPLVHEQMH